jgi:hypothetical protein
VTTWILILTVYGYSTIHTNKIEFSSKENCLAAQARFMKNKNKLDIVDAFCAKK